MNTKQLVEDGWTVEPRDRQGRSLIDALRHWACQNEGEGCACCGMPFYNRDGDPICRGCRIDAPYEREVLRRQLLRLLRQRPLRIDREASVVLTGQARQEGVLVVIENRSGESVTFTTRERWP